MGVYAELKCLMVAQADLKDQTRLFHDGSVKIQTLTESGDMGWYVLAKPVHGASKTFRRYFHANADGDFLKVSGMREAISIRDLMLEAMVEARVDRQRSNDLRNKPQI